VGCGKNLIRKNGIIFDCYDLSGIRIKPKWSRSISYGPGDPQAINSIV
jgi:hypothetical protein